MADSIRYIILESDIPYDWDDYGVYGAVLYDIQEDKIVTVKYGHGSDMKCDGNIVEFGHYSFPNEKIIDCLVKSLGLGFHVVNMGSYASHFNEEKFMGIPVEVIGGRKFKGHGYLVYGIACPVMYGLGAYHNEYTYKAVVFDPMTEEYKVVNSFSYLKYSDEWKEIFNKNIRINIKNTNDEVLSLAHLFAYNMSYSGCDRQNYLAWREKYSRRGFSEANEFIKDMLIKAHNKAEAKRNEARNLKMQEDLPNLINWVRSKGYMGDNEEDIKKEAERIWRKRNL